VHQPLRGFLVEIGDVFHNIVSRKTLNRPKRKWMQWVQKYCCHFFLQSALLPHPYFLKSLWQYYGIQIAKFTTSHCENTIFTSPLLHCKLDKFTLFYGLPKIFGLSSKKSIDCPIFLRSFFGPNFVFLGCFLLRWVGGLD
jgi:hypothetical protein